MKKKKKGEFLLKKQFYKQRQILLDTIKLAQQGTNQVITYNKERWELSSKRFNPQYRDYVVLFSYSKDRPVIAFEQYNKDTPRKPQYEAVDKGWLTICSNDSFMCYAKKLNV